MNPAATFRTFFSARDFTDWLNPVLLRELRQAVRSRQFLAVFVAVQVVMILFVTFGMAASYGNYDDSRVVFWNILALYLCVVLPLTGINALATESSEARLDLLQISQLHSRSIVLGKWLSLNVQGLLVVVSLLPYMALRYFVGSVNPVLEILTLLQVIGGSLMLTALAVCLSVVRSSFLRFGAAVGASIVAFNLVIATLRGFAFSGTGTSAGWMAWLLVVVFAFLLILLMLEFAASRISHEAQNHETSKRWIVLAAFVVTVAALMVHRNTGNALMLFLGAMITIVAISSMMHEPPRLPGVYLQLLRYGAVGRFLLYPGWPSALIFVLVTFAGFMGLVIWEEQLAGAKHLAGVNDTITLLAIAILGCLFLPRAIFEFVPFRRTSNLRVFLLIQLIAILVALLLLLVDETQNLDTKTVLCILPQAGLVYSIALENEREWEQLRMIFLMGNSLTTLASLLLCLAAAARWRKTEAMLEAEARSLRDSRLFSGEPSSGTADQSAASAEA